MSYDFTVQREGAGKWLVLNPFGTPLVRCRSKRKAESVATGFREIVWDLITCAEDYAIQALVHENENVDRVAGNRLWMMSDGSVSEDPGDNPLIASGYWAVPRRAVPPEEMPGILAPDGKGGLVAIEGAVCKPRPDLHVVPDDPEKETT